MDPSPSEGKSHSGGVVGRGVGAGGSSGVGDGSTPGGRRQTPSTLDSIAATTSTMLPSSRPLGRTRPFVETRPEGVLSGSELEGEGYEVSAEEDEDGLDNVSPAVVMAGDSTISSSRPKLPPIVSDQDSLYTTTSNYSDSDATTTTTRRRNSNRKGSASTIKAAEDELSGNTTTTGDDLQFTSQESSQQTSPIVHHDTKAIKELPRKGTGNMTVETETVSAVPTVAVTPASSNPASAISNLTNSSLKVKKSTDNVTNHAATTRGKKKKSSRQGVGSKAQIFAAKIASAVDEADSSDSDETFVYESNPADNPHSSSASHKERPSRFQHRRNLSNSSLNRPAIDSIIAGGGGSSTSGGGGGGSGHGASSVRKLSVTNPKNSSSEPSSALFMHASSSSSLTPVSNPASASSLASPATVPENLGSASGTIGGPLATATAKHHDFLIPRERANTNSSTNEPRRVASQQQGQTQSPLASQVIRPSVSGGLASRPNSPRRGASISKFDSDNLPLTSSSTSASIPANSTSRSVYGSTNNGVGAKPFLRPASSRYFDSKNHANYSRWRNYDDDEEYGEGDDEDADGDIEDVDEYQQDYSETTPLRSAGQSIRRSRKNGGVVVYSPHNYQRGRRPNQRYYFLRLFLWSLFVVISLLCLGFVLGFLLATSKPMSHVQIHNLANILVSDEVLEFNIDVAAVNPGFLAIDLYDMNLDVFAKSQYVRDEQDGSLPADGSNTMLLGSINHFNAPLTFEGGFFHRAVQHNIGDVKLANPGKNTTIEEDKPKGDKDKRAVTAGSDGDDDHPGEPDPGGGDPDTGKPPASPPKDGTNDGDDDDDDDKKNLDEGQKRWIRVSGHPFDLIVRGTFEYSLVIGRGKRTVSVSKSVHVDPDTEVFSR